MVRSLIALALFLSTLEIGSGLASAQGSCFVDPYTGEYVCQREQRFVVPRQPVCYPVSALQCGYDAWGNYYCRSIEQMRCR